MDAKVERLAGPARDRQVRIESLTERIVRLETALELAIDRQIAPTSPRTIERSAELPPADG